LRSSPTTLPCPTQRLAAQWFGKVRLCAANIRHRAAPLDVVRFGIVVEANRQLSAECPDR